MSSSKKSNKQATSVVNTPKPKKGVPRFDPETLARMVAKATAPGANMIDVGNEFGVGSQIYRYVAKWKARHAPQTPTDAKPAHTRPSPAGGQYRLTPSEATELHKLREENKKLKAELGHLYLTLREKGLL